MITAEEFFRDKLKYSSPFQEVTLSQQFINAEQAMRWAHEFAEKFKNKAEKWDNLNEKIGIIYEDEDSGGDLCDIGEIAAMELGYL